MDEVIKATVLGVAETFATTMREFVEQQKMLNQTKFDLARRERQLLADITNQKDVNGKDSFSSDVKRKAELSARKDIDAGYQHLVDLHGSAEDTIAETKTVLEVCKFNMKAYDIITR